MIYKRDLPKDNALQEIVFLELKEWSLKRIKEIVLEVIPKDCGLVGYTTMHGILYFYFVS